MSDVESKVSSGNLLQRLGDALRSFLRWFDTETEAEAGVDAQRIDWVRVIPFIGLHVAAVVGVYFVGFSWFAFWVAVGLYALRMFAITGFYHRYFSHKAFKTSRPVQFVFALIGTASVQRGPLWWASHHRNHHRHSDTEADVHSHGDGLVYLHPEEGDTATSLGAFMAEGAWSTGDQGFTIWNGVEVREGDLCPDGRPGTFRWSVDGELQTGDPSRHVLRHREVIVLSFDPVGEQLGEPPQLEALPEPILGPDFTGSTG